MGASLRKKNSNPQLPANPIEILSLLGVLALAFWAFPLADLEQPKDSAQKPILTEAKLSATRSRREIASVESPTTATIDLDCTSNAPIAVAPTVRRVRFSGHCGVIGVRVVSPPNPQSVAIFPSNGYFTTVYIATPSADSTLELEIRDPSSHQTRTVSRKIVN